MAVKISGLKRTISVPATLYLPADNGELHPHKFSVEFKRLPTSRRDELNGQLMAGKLTVPELLNEVVEGWAGMRDENDEEVPYSPAERAATEEAYSGTEQAMAVAFFDASFVNQREAAVKNSKARSGTTSA